MKSSVRSSILLKVRPLTEVDRDLVVNSVSSQSQKLFFVLTGAMDLISEEKSFLLTANQGLLIDKGKDLKFKIRKDSEVVYFELKLFEEEQWPLAKIIIGSLLMRELVKVIVERESIDQNSRLDKAMASLLILLIQQLPSRSFFVPTPKDPRALQIYDIIYHQGHFEAPLKDLATWVGASQRTIERIFKVELNMTFSKWRQLLKMQKSLELLKDKLPVADIASLVGYHSSSAFVHAFRLQFGVSPKKYYEDYS